MRIIIFALTLVALSVPVVGRIQKQPSPDQVVTTYLDLARRGRLNELRQYVTSVPESYWKARQKLVEAQMPPDTTKHDRVELIARLDPYDEYWLNSVAKEYPEILRAKDLVLDGTPSSQLDGDDASVKVTLIPRERDGHQRSWDFLMHKEQSGWKIFRIVITG